MMKFVNKIELKVILDSINIKIKTHKNGII
jgi:hypothetical protein